MLMKLREKTSIASLITLNTTFVLFVLYVRSTIVIFARHDLQSTGPFLYPWPRKLSFRNPRALQSAGFRHLRTLSY
jgi:hypothetical protein